MWTHRVFPQNLFKHLELNALNHSFRHLNHQSLVPPAKSAIMYVISMDTLSVCVYFKPWSTTPTLSGLSVVQCSLLLEFPAHRDSSRNQSQFPSHPVITLSSPHRLQIEHRHRKVWIPSANGWETHKNLDIYYERKSRNRPRASISINLHRARVRRGAAEDPESAFLFTS